MVCPTCTNIFIYINLFLQVEVQDPDSLEFDFIRILRLHIEEGSEVQLGLMACSPTAAGGSAYFSYLKFSDTDGIDHEA